MDLFIPILQGTTRQERKSMLVTEFVHDVASETEGITTEIVDPAELTLPADGNDQVNKDPKYTEITQNADAFFIVTPEYNHSFPGSLKRMLDSELANYLHKPVAFVGVSSGMFGGVRAIESLLPVVRELGLIATFTDVYVGNSYEQTTDTLKEKHTEHVQKAFKELIWMAQALKWGRENLESK